jgi:hypothetical protein
MRTPACASGLFDRLLGNTIIFIAINPNYIAHHQIAKTRPSQQRGCQKFSSQILSPLARSLSALRSPLRFERNRQPPQGTTGTRFARDVQWLFCGAAVGVCL